MMSYRRVEKESDELLCTVWSLVMVRGEPVAQEVKKAVEYSKHDFYVLSNFVIY